MVRSSCSGVRCPRVLQSRLVGHRHPLAVRVQPACGAGDPLLRPRVIIIPLYLQHAAEDGFCFLPPLLPEQPIAFLDGLVALEAGKFPCPRFLPYKKFVGGF